MSASPGVRTRSRRYSRLHPTSEWPCFVSLRVGVCSWGGGDPRTNRYTGIWAQPSLAVLGCRSGVHATSNALRIEALGSDLAPAPCDMQHGVAFVFVAFLDMVTTGGTPTLRLWSSGDTVGSPVLLVSFAAVILRTRLFVDSSGRLVQTSSGTVTQPFLSRQPYSCFVHFSWASMTIWCTEDRLIPP